MRPLNRLWPAYRAYLRRRTTPILVGPFRGEIGFEALYWVPFVRALGLPRSRLVTVTRGGAGLWYPADQHVELFDLRDPRDLRIENIRQKQQTGLLKQLATTAFDRAVVRDAAAALHLRHYDVLHPSWMYQTLEPFWIGRQGLAWLTARLLPDGHKPEPLAAIEATGLTLPEAFVAVRFYARSTFPISEVTNAVVRSTVEHLARERPVVVLNSPLHFDEHLDFPLPEMPNVWQLKDAKILTPQNNLALQSAILSRAVGFVGTYGGLAQLAVQFRKPSLSWYVDWQGTALAHHHWAQALSLVYKVPYHVLPVRDLPYLRAFMPRLTVTQTGPSTRAADPVFRPAVPVETPVA